MDLYGVRVISYEFCVGANHYSPDIRVWGRMMIRPYEGSGTHAPGRLAAATPSSLKGELRDVARGIPLYCAGE